MHYSIITGLSFALLIACSPAPAPIAISARDPSNPNAPEGTTPAVVASAASPAAAHDQHHHTRKPRTRRPTYARCIRR